MAIAGRTVRDPDMFQRPCLAAHLAADPDGFDSFRLLPTACGLTPELRA
jgi:hypothetical protein